MTLYVINHYMPELGHPTAGSCREAEGLEEAERIVQDELRHLKAGHKIIVAIDDEE